MSVHSMTLVSLRLFRKNLGNLLEFFGQMVRRPPWQKNARTPMGTPKSKRLLKKWVMLKRIANSYTYISRISFRAQI